MLEREVEQQLNCTARWNNSVTAPLRGCSRMLGIVAVWFYCARCSGLGGGLLRVVGIDQETSCIEARLEKRCLTMRETL
jgi:hypothetical protein